MEKMEKEDPKKFNDHFRQFIAAGKGPGDIKKMYQDAHEAIRKDSSRADIGDAKRHEAIAKAHPLQKKLTYEQRKQRVANKKTYKAWKQWKDDQDSEDESEEDDE